MANRHLRPVFILLLLTLFLALPPAKAQRVQGKPASTEGTSTEGAAREFFDRYTALHGACDPAVLDLFAEDAGITIAQVHPTSGQSRLLEFPLFQYRRILPQELKRYQTRGECLVFTAPTFAVQEDGSVWIETSRTVHQGRFVVPLRLRVAPQEAGEWRILEQRAGEPRASRTVAEKIELWRQLGTEQAVEALEEFWRGSDPPNQARAAEALVEIAERFQEQGAVRQAGQLGLDLYLSSAAPEVRRRAFAVYVRSVGDGAVPRLQSILEGRQDADFEELALELLAELSGPRALALQRQVGLRTETVSALDGQVVEWIPYQLPAYGALREEQRRDLEIESDAREYERVRRDSRFVLRKARYRSGDLLVVAYVYGPLQEPEEPLPVVLFTRGSYVMGDAAPLLLPTFHRLASEGFLVVAPQYRGSDGGQGRDEMGGADVADVLNAARLAVELPGADPRNLFLYGVSRGGMMGFQAIRDGLQVRAAVTLGAFTDLAATLEGNPEAQSLAHRIWPDFERNREEIIHRRSALRWAEELKVPLLLLHGGEDEQISPRQTLRLGLRLEELGHPYQLYILEGQDHTVSDRAASRDHMAIRWFQRYQAGPIRRSGG